MAKKNGLDKIQVSDGDLKVVVSGVSDNPNDPMMNNMILHGILTLIDNLDFRFFDEDEGVDESFYYAIVHRLGLKMYEAIEDEPKDDAEIITMVQDSVSMYLGNRLFEHPVYKGIVEKYKSRDNEE